VTRLPPKNVEQIEGKQRHNLRQLPKITNQMHGRISMCTVREKKFTLRADWGVVQIEK
jgi:hypothetical protein